MVSEQDTPILGGIDTATWSAEDGVAYEVALEGINHVVGAYSGLIARQEAAQVPDTVAIATWSAARQTWAHKRRALDPADGTAIERIRRQSAAQLAELRRP